MDEDRGMSEREKLVPLGEAQEILGVSRFKVTQLVKEGKLPTFVSELDRRQKLVRLGDVEDLARPRASTNSPHRIETP